MALANTIKTLPDALAAACRALTTPVMACAAPEDGVVLESIIEAARRRLITPLLIGDAHVIIRVAQAHGIVLDGVRLDDEPDRMAACRRAVEACRAGDAQILMKGSLPTATILAAALDRDRGLSKGRALSHVTAFEPPGYGRVMLLADAGVNIAPDTERKIDIIRNCLELASCIGVAEPRVALLAAIEHVNQSMPTTLDIERVLARVKGDASLRAKIGGPYSLDVAVSGYAAAEKKVNDGIAGQANILIAPDIEAGNVLYKSLTCFAGLDLASLVLGAKAPLVVASRADSIATKLNSIALAVLMANTRIDVTSCTP